MEKENAQQSLENGGNVKLGHVSAQGGEEQAGIDLMAMGYKPELKREFTLLQLIGYAFTTTSSWLGITGAFTTGVVIGGPACVSMGLVIMLVANICIGVTLGELMSAMPNAGAQYFWAMQLAPRRLVRFSAYFTGLCNVLGACSCGAANSMAMISMILGCVKLYDESIDFAAWQVFLIAIAFNVALVAFNLREEILSRLATIGLYVSVCCCITIIVAVPSVAKEHTSASYIFTNVENSSGWTSNGMAFLVGLINSNWAFGALDSATHLAEETPDPSRSGPKAVMATVGVGFITAFPLTCSLMYSLSDYDRVVNSATGSPLLELFYLVTDSKAAAIGLMICIMLPYAICMINIQTYQTRIIWAFSRDNGLPFSKFWSVVHPTLGVPLNALLGGILVNALLDLLYVASSTAYNSILTGAIVFPYLSYLFPIVFSLVRGNNQKRGPFYLGSFGVVARVGTLLWSVFAVVIYSFPFNMPVTGGNMNYVSAIYGIFLIFLGLDWALRGRKKFNGHNNALEH